jgi:hypothetical protein
MIELAHPPARVWQYSKPADFAPGSAAKRFSNSVTKEYDHRTLGVPWQIDPGGQDVIWINARARGDRTAEAWS